MLRGEFIRGDGLVIPNNITTYGIKLLMQMAFTNSGYALYMGLANCNPDPELDIADLNEPTIATHGYARQEITRDATGWPVQGLLNDEQYYETKSVVFAASGGNFDKAITRPVLINSLDATSGVLVFSLGSPYPDELLITPATDVALRTFKYRIYGR